MIEYFVLFIDSSLVLQFLDFKITVGSKKDSNIAPEILVSVNTFLFLLNNPFGIRSENVDTDFLKWFCEWLFIGHRMS